MRVRISSTSFFDFITGGMFNYLCASFVYFFQKKFPVLEVHTLSNDSKGDFCSLEECEDLCKEFSY